MRYVEPTAAGVPFRLMPTLVLGLSFVGYFAYLVAEGYLTNQVQDMEGSPASRVWFYVVAQGLSGLGLLGCVLWQAYRWCQLEATITGVERLVPLTMKKTRVDLA